MELFLRTPTLGDESKEESLTSPVRIVMANGFDNVYPDLNPQNILQALNLTSLRWDILNTDYENTVDINNDGIFSFNMPDIDLPKEITLNIDSVLELVNESEPLEITFNQVTTEISDIETISELSLDSMSLNSEESIDVITNATTTAIISEWFKGDLSAITNQIRGTTTISGQIDLQRIVDLAMEKSYGTANLNLSNVVQKTNMSTLKWSLDSGESGIVEINKHTGSFNLIVPTVTPPKTFTFHIDDLEFWGVSKPSYLTFDIVNRYVSDIDVITSASTTASIDNWLMEVNHTNNSLAGKINIDYVFQQVYEQGNWIEAETTNYIIASQFEGQALQLLINNEVQQTVLLHNVNYEGQLPEYPFEFNHLDLTNIDNVTFKLVNEEIVFWGVTKPSVIILNDVTTALNTSTPLSFNTVGNLEFENQSFNFALSEQLIEQKSDHFLNIEVIVPSTSCYTLCASHSGKLLSEATEVDSIIYYNNQAIGQNNTEIANAASPKLFSFHRNFQLQIQDATQIVAGQTYTTTITWTLSDAP